MPTVTPPLVEAAEMPPRKKAAKAEIDWKRAVPSHTPAEDFVYQLEDGFLLRWEAVIREEQELPLSRKQERALDELIGFDEKDARILVRARSERLGLGSVSDRVADFL